MHRPGALPCFISGVGAISDAIVVRRPIVAKHECVVTTRPPLTIWEVMHIAVAADKRSTAMPKQKLMSCIQFLQAVRATTRDWSVTAKLKVLGE